MARRQTQRSRRQEHDPDGRYADPLHPEWLEHPLPLRFWQDRNNHKRYLRWLGQQLGYRRWEDWYQVRLRDVIANHGVSLISNYYGKCPVRAVTTTFPEYDWQEWLFHIAPNGFWDDRANRRRYMRWLGQQLGFAKLDDWYRVTLRDFEQHHGEGLLKQFRASPVAAVKDAFPSHDWKEWQFTLTPKGFWAVWQNRRRYMDWLGPKLRYKRSED